MPTPAPRALSDGETLVWVTVYTNALRRGVWTLDAIQEATAEVLHLRRGVSETERRWGIDSHEAVMLRSILGLGDADDASR